MNIIWQIVFYLVLIAIPTVGIYLLYKNAINKQKIAWYQSKQNVVLAILVPKDNEKTPVAAEQMFASLHGIFRGESRWQDQISFEIVSKDKYIQFYVCLPKYLKDFVEGQIYAQYPDVEIFETVDYTQENFNGFDLALALLTLTKEEVYPIKSFTSFEVDPLASITAVLSKVETSEQIWIQIIIQPVSDIWQLKGVSYVTAIKAGQSTSFNLSRSISTVLVKLLGELFKAIVGGGETVDNTQGAEVKLSGPQEEALKEVERKSTKLGFSTKIRIAVIGKNTHLVRAKLDSVVGVFKQFSTTNLNSFKIKKITTTSGAINAYRRRKFYDKGFIMNIEELASLFHLPTITVETPNIVWAGSKKGEPPSNLPVVETVSDKDLTVFAKTNFRSIEKTFGIKRIDRRLHMYIIGKTGTGKSTLLENMIIDDIEKGQGVAYIDPHGQAIDYILDHIPSNRINDVVYFNPADRDWPIGFNPLEEVDPNLKNIVASGVVGIFKKIFGDSWGPRLEYILRNTILAALEYPNSTLLSVMRILTDKDFRKKVIVKITDPVVRDFFINEYEKWDQRFRLEAIQSIQNKVGQFLSSSMIRNIIGQPKSTVDLSAIMNGQKILLVDLSVGKIGEDSSSLLGSMLITKLQLAAMQRANISEAERKDFYLYVDEFQNFATESFAVILSEARKYHLNLIMTNQYIEQMLENVAKAIFGNVGTIISFRVGATDASGLVKEYEPVFTANDMVNLGNYNIYVKMAIDGVTRPAFSALTLPPCGEENKNREKIINVSRERYAISREFVETKIAEWDEEARNSKVNEEEAKKKKTFRPKMETVIVEPTQRTQTGLGEKKETAKPIKYEIATDEKGEKWYIPVELEEVNNGDKSEEQKKMINKKKIDDNKPKVPVQQVHVGQEAHNETENIDKTMVINKSKPRNPIIQSELEKNIHQEKRKQALISTDELEEHLFAKQKKQTDNDTEVQDLESGKMVDID